MQVRRAALMVTFCVVVISASLAQVAPTASPQLTKDGWPTASLESLELSAKPLRDMDTAVRAGEFEKIGSALIAPPGKWISEDDLEGARNTVQGPRAVPK